MLVLIIHLKTKGFSPLGFSPVIHPLQVAIPGPGETPLLHMKLDKFFHHLSGNKSVYRCLKSPNSNHDTTLLSANFSKMASRSWAISQKKSYGELFKFKVGFWTIPQPHVARSQEGKSGCALRVGGTYTNMPVNHSNNSLWLAVVTVNTRKHYQQCQTNIPENTNIAHQTLCSISALIAVVSSPPSLLFLHVSFRSCNWGLSHNRCPEHSDRAALSQALPTGCPYINKHTETPHTPAHRGDRKTRETKNKPRERWKGWQ